MSKGWSVALLFALILLLIARYFLHIGGFWDLGPFRALTRRSPQLVTLLSVISLRDLQENLLPGEHNVVLTAMLWVARGVLLLGAVLFVAFAVVLIVSAFFGGPL